MQKFTARKLEEIEAVKYDGTNGEAIVKWVKDAGLYAEYCSEYVNIQFHPDMSLGRTYPGYWIVKDSEDCFSVYSQDDFEDKYKKNLDPNDMRSHTPIDGAFDENEHIYCDYHDTIEYK